MNRSSRRQTQCRQEVHTVTYLNSKHYRPSGIPIHRQNSYRPRSQRCTDRRREAHSREPANKRRNLLYKQRNSKTDVTVLITWNVSGFRNKNNGDRSQNPQMGRSSSCMKSSY
jgi:hypothetical protein